MSHAEATNDMQTRAGASVGSGFKSLPVVTIDHVPSERCWCLARLYLTERLNVWPNRGTLRRGDSPSSHRHRRLRDNVRQSEITSRTRHYPRVSPG